MFYQQKNRINSWKGTTLLLLIFESTNFRDWKKFVKLNTRENKVLRKLQLQNVIPYYTKKIYINMQVGKIPSQGKIILK